MGALGQFTIIGGVLLVAAGLSSAAYYRGVFGSQGVDMSWRYRCVQLCRLQLTAAFFRSQLTVALLALGISGVGWVCSGCLITGRYFVSCHGDGTG